MTLFLSTIRFEFNEASLTFECYFNTSLKEHHASDSWTIRTQHRCVDVLRTICRARDNYNHYSFHSMSRLAGRFLHFSLFQSNCEERIQFCVAESFRRCRSEGTSSFSLQLGGKLLLSTWHTTLNRRPAIITPGSSVDDDAKCCRWPFHWRHNL